MLGGAETDLGLMIRDREVTSIRGKDMAVSSFRGTSSSKTNNGMVKVVSEIRVSRVNVSRPCNHRLVSVHQCLRLEHHRMGDSYVTFVGYQGILLGIVLIGTRTIRPLPLGHLQ